MDDSRTYRTLLVGVDGSEGAQKAFERGLLLARDLQAKLYVLHIVDTPTARGLDILSLHLFTGSIAEEVGKAGAEAAEAAVARAREAGVAVEGLAGEGKPGEQLCRVAADRGVDMIVLGATGKSNIEDVILGSVSEYVIDHATCPVMVVGKRSMASR
jgi:nucleotide-binding universal stress UspA family protein